MVKVLKITSIFCALFYILLCVLMYFFQEKLLFHPIPLAPQYKFTFDTPFTEYKIPVNNNQILSVLSFNPAPNTPQKGTIIYYHGNGQNIEAYYNRIKLMTQWGYKVWVNDYPQFGKTTTTLSEYNLLHEAQITYDLATKIDTNAKANSIIFGRSMGTCPAAYIARYNPCQKLILETPYCNMYDMCHRYFPILPAHALLRYPLQTDTLLPYIKQPITILQGTADYTVPYESAELLKPYLKKGIDTFVIFKNGGHNNLDQFELYHSILKQRL
jgi:pimeloyl-ACP methyl ester carboxylesterase